MRERSYAGSFLHAPAMSACQLGSLSGLGSSIRGVLAPDHDSSHRPFACGSFALEVFKSTDETECEIRRVGCYFMCWLCFILFPPPAVRGMSSVPRMLTFERAEGTAEK